MLTVWLSAAREGEVSSSNERSIKMKWTMPRKDMEKVRTESRKQHKYPCIECSHYTHICGSHMTCMWVSCDEDIWPWGCWTFPWVTGTPHSPGSDCRRASSTWRSLWVYCSHVPIETHSHLTTRSTWLPGCLLKENNFSCSHSCSKLKYITILKHQIFNIKIISTHSSFISIYTCYALQVRTTPYPWSEV